MDISGGSSPGQARGLVVMLVDNGVEGDSRVQKQAASAAAAGWRVILLGKSEDGKEHTWDLGGATVRLVPMPSQLGKHRHEYRRVWLRRPLAYPPTGIAPFRWYRMRAWRRDLGARHAAIGVAVLSGRLRGLRRVVQVGAIKTEKLAAWVIGRWVSLRYHQLVSAQKARRRLDGRWDRAYAWLWRKVRPVGYWRRLEPRLLDFELAFGPVLDELQPDIIHANDFYMLGVGARATMRGRVAGRKVKLVWDAHEFLPGIRPRSENVRWLDAHRAYEREYAPVADAVVTVSEELADLLVREHGLATRPTVVLNAPLLAESAGEAPSLRAACEVGADQPLIVYSGAAAEQRGLGTVIEALPLLPGVHVALVARRSTYVDGLLARAATLGVADRVHLAPYVTPAQVVSYLAEADAGLIPIHHWLNHEIALITKYFEYAHARLPIVVSDVRTMAQVTRETGVGEVFTAQDAQDLARAVRDVLAEPGRYRGAYERDGLLATWSWEVQARILDEVYTRLRPDLPGRPRSDGVADGAGEVADAAAPRPRRGAAIGVA